MKVILTTDGLWEVVQLSKERVDELIKTLHRLVVEERAALAAKETNNDLYTEDNSSA